ncbi:MAG: hypothetical protein AAB885_00065 [Patescibacteria group bacterium]
MPRFLTATIFLLLLLAAAIFNEFVFNKPEKISDQGEILKSAALLPKVAVDPSEVFKHY